MTESVETEIIQKWLGTKPFVLVELDGEITGPGDDDYIIHMTMEFGGGVNRNGAFGVIGTILEENGWTITPPEGFDPDADD